MPTRSEKWFVTLCVFLSNSRSHFGSKAKTVDVLFIPILSTVVTPGMPLYVTLLSLGALMTLYGCGSCDKDGEEYLKCANENYVAYQASSPFGAAALCQHFQWDLDCYEGFCDCTCLDMFGPYPDAKIGNESIIPYGDETVCQQIESEKAKEETKEADAAVPESDQK